MPKKVLIIGAGFSGAIIARELANSYQYFVDIADVRSHIGGNAYDEVHKETGIRYHKYGPHIFHTNNREVFDYLSKFTQWTPYEHKVKAIISNGTFLTFPPNKETYDYYQGDKETLLDVFFRPYTRKMWGMELEELDPDIINRVPIHPYDYDDRYFKKDQYQFMPVDGYTLIFEKLLDHPSINVQLNYKISADDNLSKYDYIFNSSPIDEWYDFKFGPLPYRSIKFHQSIIKSPRLFTTTTTNFTHSGPYTRVTEWKNFPHHGHNPEKTLLTFEEPCDYVDNNWERYYPVKDIDGKNRERYKQYAAIENDKMKFIGRCGQYVYTDMDQAINSALQISKRFLGTHK